MLMMSESGLLTSGHSAALYVDNAATGANNGTSWANAWQSFSAINWGVIGPGSILYISGGTTSKIYAGAGIVVGSAGTPGRPVTITRGIDAGHNGTPILDGQNTGSRWYGIDNGWSGASPKNYVIVSRLSLRNFESAGLHARNTTAGVIFDDNDVLCGSSTADHPRGIDIRLNTGLIVRNNRVTTPASTIGQTDGIFSGGNNNYLYENNTITISNIDNTGHSDCFQTDGDGSGILRDNVFIGSTAGSNNHNIWLHAIQTGSILQVYNNVCVARGGQFNVTYWRELVGSGDGTVLFYNNTIYGGSRAVNLERVTNVEIKNNIIWPDDLGVGVRSTLNDLITGNVSHNLVWVPNANAAFTTANGNRSYAQWTADGYNANGVNADPLFIVTGTDFRLYSGSPALNAGLTIPVVINDLLGLDRPQGAAYDIGAYETLAVYGMVDFGATNNSRYYTIPHVAALDIANGAGFAWGFFARVTVNTGSTVQYVLSSGATPAVPRFTIYLHKASDVVLPGEYEVLTADADGTLPDDLHTISTPDTDGVLRLIVVQYNGSNLWQMWFCTPGGTATLEATDNEAAWDGIVAPTNWFVGARSDLESLRYWQNELGGLFRANRSLTQAEIEDIAGSSSPVTVLGTSCVEAWPFLAGASVTEVGIVQGIVATRQGTGWP